MGRLDHKPIVLPVPGSDLVLEGIYFPFEGDEPPGAVVAPPHPLYGGSLQSPVVMEVAQACREAGHATVCFNWRGVGASTGRTSGDAEPADADYEAALAHVSETVAGPVLAAGYSFGSAAAVRAALRNPRVLRLVLVAPPPTLVDAALLDSFGGPVLVVVGSEDAFAPVPELEKWVLGKERRRLEVVPGADHFFMSGLAAVGRCVSDWLGA